MSNLTISDFADLLGRTLEEAKTLTNYKIRVLIEDGETRVVTCDLRTNRLNVSVQNGLISQILHIG